MTELNDNDMDAILDEVEELIPQNVELPTNPKAPDIILPPKQNVIIDSQVFTTLQSCGRLTDFRFNHHFKGLGGKSVSLEMGSIMHAILESYYQNIINGLTRSSAIPTAIVAGREYVSSIDEDGKANVKNSNEDDVELVFKTAEEYFDYYKNDFWTPLEVEVVKGKVIYEDDEVRIMWKAKYDEITDTNSGIFPVDHKTMKQRRDTNSLNNQFKGQCILLGTRQIYINKVGFQKTLKPHEKFTRPPVVYTADRLLEWQSVIVPYWVKTMLMYNESGYWPPNYTHCENKYGFCQFKEVCEVDRNLREQTLGMQFYVGKPWDISNVGDES